MAQRVAPVPALESRPMTGADGEFAALNKQLRACYVCKLIKTGPQVQLEVQRTCLRTAQGFMTHTLCCFLCVFMVCSSWTVGVRTVAGWLRRLSTATWMSSPLATSAGERSSSTGELPQAVAVAVAASQLGVGGNGVLPSVLMVPRSTTQPQLTAAVAVSCLVCRHVAG